MTVNKRPKHFARLETKMKKLSLYLIVSFVALLSMDISATNQKVTLKGQWISEKNGQVMLDPQTSGLKLWRGRLLSISDGSAHISQQRQLHIIDPKTAKLAPDSMQMVISDNVKKSCFAEYLSNEPDYEALAIDPKNDKVIYVATEDARSVSGLSPKCLKRYRNTGSTDYPSLLVRFVIKDATTVELTHVRPLHFDPKFKVGNFPNDGIEGLAFGKNNDLYFALEKDSQKNARIFSLKITADFWQSEDFANLIDLELNLPQFVSGNHPINGMDYLPIDNHPGYLIAAARNDNQLWLIDLAKNKPTRVIDLEFFAPTNISDGSCPQWEKMNNSSLEGVGIIDDTIWLVNDPWKKNYMKNVSCQSNREKYKQMAPLLFSLPIENNWISR